MICAKSKKEKSHGPWPHGHGLQAKCEKVVSAQSSFRFVRLFLPFRLQRRLHPHPRAKSNHSVSACLCHAPHARVHPSSARHDSLITKRERARTTPRKLTRMARNTHAQASAAVVPCRQHLSTFACGTPSLFRSPHLHATPHAHACQAPPHHLVYPSALALPRFVLPPCLARPGSQKALKRPYR